MKRGAKLRFPNRDKRIYRVWYSMNYRCAKASQERFRTYIGCTVNEYFYDEDYFHEWWGRQIGADKVGWELDKDILIKGNKEYGPDTCVLVPVEINLLVNVTKGKRDLPLGVHYHTKDRVFKASVANGIQTKYLGSFTNAEDAFECFKVAKEVRIKEVAEKWKDEIDPRVYEALINWTIEVTD